MPGKGEPDRDDVIRSTKFSGDGELRSALSSTGCPATIPRLRSVHSRDGDDPEKLGKAAGAALLARGGDQILDAVYGRGLAVPPQP